jgi:hypothetical protein
MPEAEPAAIMAFKSAVLSAAVDAIVKEMTPEKMRACADQIIKDALSELSSSQYSMLGRAVKEAAEKAMAEQLATPEAKAAIKVAVVAGIEGAMAVLPGEIKGRVTDLALKNIGEAVAQAMQGGRRY